MGGESASSSSARCASLQQDFSQNQDSWGLAAASLASPRRGRMLWSEEMEDEQCRAELRTPSPDNAYEARSRSLPSASLLDASAPEFAPPSLADAAPVFVPVMLPMPWQSQDPYEGLYGMPCAEAYFESWPLERCNEQGFDYGQAAAPSAGSMGHPYSCGPACKYASKAKLGKDCKDGANCTHCHLCAWSSTAYSKQRRQRRKAAHRQWRQQPFQRRDKEWNNDAESTAVGSTGSPSLSESESPNA